MLSLLKRKPKPHVEEKPVALIECPTPALEPELAAEPMRRMEAAKHQSHGRCRHRLRRDRQGACISKAALFEDMVAERLEALQSQGVTIETSRS